MKPRPAQQRTRHRSAPAHTPACSSKKLASTPPELAGAQPAVPAPHAPRPAGQRLGPRLGDHGAPGVPISHRGAPRPPEQGRCALNWARCRGAHRAGPWAAVRAGAGRLQGGAAKWPRHGPQLVATAPSRAGARRLNRARAHIPGTEQNSRGGRPRPAHSAEPPGPLHLYGHFGKLPRTKISVLRVLFNRGHSLVTHTKKKTAFYEVLQ